MRHFTKYLLLCLAFVLPNMIGAQTIDLTQNAECPVIEVDHLLASGDCDVDVTTLIPLITGTSATGFTDITAINQATLCQVVGADGITPLTPNSYGLDILVNGTSIQSQPAGMVAVAATATTLAPGSHIVDYVVTQNGADGCLPKTCSYEITIEIPNQVLACNNLIQVSLDTDCMIEVTADMMLEGALVCDEDDFVIMIDDVVESMITSPGSYQVSVNVGPYSCWGTVVAEDKLAPVLECPIVPTLTCTDDLTPGAMLESGANLVGTAGTHGDCWTDSDTPMAADSTVCIEFNNTTAPMGSTITSISIDLDISHTNITDLKAVLEVPGVDTINLFTTPLSSASDPNCERDDIMVIFSDSGTNDHSLLDLDPTCRLLIAPSVLGSFKPEQLFSTLNGGDANVVFKLVITDCNPSANDGCVNSASMAIRYTTGATIPFPTDGDYTLDPSSGEGCYTIASTDGVCGPVRGCYTDNIVDACNGGIFQVVERTWTVWDASGNMDQIECTMEIQGSDISNATLESTGMTNFDGLGGNPYFTCQDIFEMDENGNPSPSVTGRPRDISSNNMAFCGNIEMTYKDTRIDICAGSYKVIREWILIDWCDNGQPVTFNQIIKVVDEQPPITTCSIADCFEVPVTNPFTCTADFDVPAPVVLNECGGYTWSISYLPANLVPGFVDDGTCQQPDSELTTGLFIDVDVTRTHEDTNPITLTGLPLGQVWIRYNVEDECGNSSPSGAGACEIRVIDETEPTAVCDQHTTVSLNTECEAQINAETFDDLSYDSCGDIVLYEAQREGGTYGPSVRFGKADLQGPVKVNLRVTDAAGLTNVCWAEVIVRDKYVPVFTSCPADVTISCEFTDDQLQAAIGTATAEDNCPDCFSIEMTIGDPSQNSCGAGSVDVVWKLSDTNQLDGDGNPLLVDECSQRISFENTSPFNESDITFPSDKENLGCADLTDPSSTGEVSFNSDACSLVAISSDDLVFYSAEGACRKILRTWTVIDWCQYDETNPSAGGIWTNIQVLKVVDNAAPVLTNGTDTQVCAETGCMGDINIDLIATDDCTGTSDISWTWTLDYDSDGSVDMQDTDILVDSVLTLRGSHPVGTHAVSVILADGCDNTSEAYTFNIIISDCLEPTPECASTINTVLGSDGTAEIWASDFDNNSSDACGGPVTFSFSANIDDTNKTLTCADLSDGVRRAIEYQVWVHDADGNSDFCTVTLDLQDNNDACPDVESPSASISGFIMTEQNEMVNNVDVQVTSALPEFPINFTTTNTGDYTFTDLLTGYNYDVSSYKNDDHINGVSTLDIVLIQKHILGLVLLDSPYKIIAADTDNNQRVSAADLVTLRKLILGQIVDFPNGQNSWRFVDEGHTFNNLYNPFPFDEQLNVSDLAFNEYNMDFMAVKIGDVNASVNPTSFQGHIAEVRSNKVVEFTMEDVEAQSGETVNIPVTASNFDELLGFQFTIEFDQAQLEFVGIDKAGLTLTESNLGLTNIDRGMIAVSWNDVEANSFDSEDVLFTLSFKANTSSKLSDAISISSRITNAEAYSDDLSLVNTKLVFKDGDVTTFEVRTFELYQNNPNPFNGNTSIGFNLAESGEAVLSVYDVTGKMLIRIVEDYQGGYNEVSLNTADLGGMQGVMYYTLESKGHTATKKMVGVK